MQQWKRRGQALVTLVVLSSMMTGGPAVADISKASDWLGRSVVTVDGEPLGRIEDFAIDIEQARITYLVVSVGSFLIDDALIAVDPDALGPSADGQHLVLNSDSLANAKRFNDNGWPASADVLPTTEVQPAPSVDGNDAPEPQVATTGRAVISDGRRQATYADGERKIEPVRRATTRRAPASADDATAVVRGEAGEVIDASREPLPTFGTLDGNDDGRLDRRELGAYLGLKESFADLDVDDSGSLDRFELDRLRELRASATSGEG